MAMRFPSKGYDAILGYSKDEIYQMYVAEGMSSAVATRKAASVSQAISSLNKAEQRLWEKVRKHEVPSEKLTMLVD